MITTTYKPVYSKSQGVFVIERTVVVASLVEHTSIVHSTKKMYFNDVSENNNSESYIVPVRTPVEFISYLDALTYIKNRSWKLSK